MGADEIAILMNEIHKIRSDLSFVELRQITDLIQEEGFVKQSEGHWIRHPNTYECSVCKEELFIEYAEDYDAIADWELNFCPFCHTFINL